MNFDAELSYIDKAAQVPLENVIADINELDKHMESVRKEAEKCANNHLLKDFLNNSEDKLKKTKQDSKLAQVCISGNKKIQDYKHRIKIYQIYYRPHLKIV